MKYDGVVIRIDELYLFVFDPDKKIITDGINISDHVCYKDLTDDNLMVVEVIFKDGTEELEKVDLDEFIYNISSGGENHNTFIYIQDKMLFSMDNKRINIRELIDKGELNDIAINCIGASKNDDYVKKSTTKNNKTNG